MVTAAGLIIRLTGWHFKIRAQRSGVKLIDLNDKDKVAAIAVVEEEDEEEYFLNVLFTPVLSVNMDKK